MPPSKSVTVHTNQNCTMHFHRHNQPHAYFVGNRIQIPIETAMSIKKLYAQVSLHPRQEKVFISQTPGTRGRTPYSNNARMLRKVRNILSKQSEQMSTLRDLLTTILKKSIK